MMFDGRAYGEEIVDLVRGFVEREIAPLKAENESLKGRLAALEARPGPEKGDAGEKGQDGSDGVSPAPEAVADIFRPIAEQLISEAVTKAVSELPPPERGEKGEPGNDADPLAVGEMVVAGVAKAVGALPLPKDGKDAAGIVEALKDSGELVLTLQDGRLIRTGVRDGEKGQDGRDGFGFDDMDVAVLDDDRTIELSFRRGEDEKAFTLKWPTLIDRGVFKLDEQYESGDGVTWGGQFYIANESTKGVKPDQAKDGKPWRLTVRKGRDGKDAKGG